MHVWTEESVKAGGTEQSSNIQRQGCEKAIRFMLCGSRSRSYIKAQYKETLSNKLPKIECSDTAGDELPVTDGIIG